MFEFRHNRFRAEASPVHYEFFRERFVSPRPNCARAQFNLPIPERCIHLNPTLKFEAANFGGNLVT